MVGYISKKQTEKQVKLADKSADIKNSVESFINSCAEKTLVDGVRLLGKQGGIIYMHQTGNRVIINPNLPDKSSMINGLSPLTKPNTASPYDDEYILYGIGLPSFPPSGMTETNYDNPKYHYPWKCFPYFADTSGSEKSRDESANCQAGLTDTKSFISDDDSFGTNILLPLYATSDKPSINGALTNFINANLSTCFQNFNSFKERGLIVSNKKPIDIKSSLTINSENILLKIKMPTTITKVRTGEQYTIDTYSINSQIRLGRIYEFTKQLIAKDTTDISFSIDQTLQYSTITPYYNNKITVSKQDTNNEKHDDIITVTDTGSKIPDGLMFSFARANRRPALHFGFSISDITESGKITLEKLKGFVSDPDEDFDLIGDIDLLDSFSLKNFKFTQGGDTEKLSYEDFNSKDMPITGTLSGTLSGGGEFTLTVTDYIDSLPEYISEGYSDSQKIS